MIGCRRALGTVRSRARTACRRRPPFAGGAMGNRAMFPITTCSRYVRFQEPMRRPCGPGTGRGEFGAMLEPARRTGRLNLLGVTGYGSGCSAERNIAAGRLATSAMLENSR